MGWFFITILLPLTAPVLLMLILRTVPLPQPWARTPIVELIQDGQLCWLAMSFCASALYELATRRELLELLGQTLVGYLNAASMITLFLSSTYAMLGAVFGARRHEASECSGVQRYGQLVASLLLTGLAGAGYTAIHSIGKPWGGSHGR